MSMDEQAGSSRGRPKKRADSEAAAAPPAGVTPSMAQYLEIKAANPDSLLWDRMGDFYELFFEDAVVAADALSIVLTKRGKHLGEDIPMCGVPVHRADEYLQRLIRLGNETGSSKEQIIADLAAENERLRDQLQQAEALNADLISRK